MFEETRYDFRERMVKGMRDAKEATLSMAKIMREVDKMEDEKFEQMLLRIEERKTRAIVILEEFNMLQECCLDLLSRLVEEMQKWHTGKGDSTSQ